MFTSTDLREIHDRSHRSLKGLLAHCGAFPVEDLNREWDGFGYPTIRLQLHHLLGAERYWIGVLEGRVDADEDDPRYPTIASLGSLRDEVARSTAVYLRAASDEELNTPRAMNTWGGKVKTLTPAHVFLRTQTHAYQHQGQVAALCRLMGKPVPPGLDYPHS